MDASPKPSGAEMTPKELEGWARRLGEAAMRMLAEHDACPPTALVVVQGVPISTEMVLAGEEDKTLLRAYFEMAARGGAEACALVVEAWRTRISTAARALAARPGLKSLAEVPGRQEVLFVHAVSPQGAAIRTFRIVRRRDRAALVVDPAASADDTVSRFLTGLPWVPADARPPARRRNASHFRGRQRDRVKARRQRRQAP